MCISGHVVKIKVDCCNGFVIIIRRERGIIERMI
jgi:hypothetical protein